MELELERTQLNGFETVLNTTVCREEMLEAIVPDACPDILTICDTEGQVCLSGKQAQEGRAEISGTIYAAVLYLPDGAQGMRRMEVSIPFSCTADSPGIHAGCSVVAVPRVQSAETRLLNPRKVLVKVNLAVCVAVYAPVQEEICAGVTNPETAGVEQLTQRQETCVVANVEEKSFPFTDDLNLPGGRPEAEELLRHRLCVCCTESKIIGNKLIFKGSAQLQTLCRGTDGGLFTAEFELPFSQIMEVVGAGEESACEIQVVPLSCACTLDGGDGRTVSVALELLAQAVVRETRSVAMLSDVYSTTHTLVPDFRTYSLSQLLEQGVRRQTVREILETGALAREVADAYVTIGTVAQSREGERLNLTAQVTVSLLCMDEEGAVSGVTRTIPVSCPVELPADAVCSCVCSATGQVYAAPTSGGVEVRFPLDFQVVALSVKKTAGVENIRLEEEAPGQGVEQPSIVLRTVGAGERLWDIAKAYCTTARDIMQANDLEQEELPAGELLLIPRTR